MHDIASYQVVLDQMASAPQQDGERRWGKDVYLIIEV